MRLDKGVMSKPTKPDTGNRTSRSLDFASIIAKGENSNGQTTIAPAEVSRGGQTGGEGYRSYNWGNNTDGDRWNTNPMLNKPRDWEAAGIPVINTKKKK